MAAPDVIEKLAGGAESPTDGDVDSPQPAEVVPTDGDTRRVTGRAPRERGVVVDLEDVRVHADSVRDLYEQILRILVDRGYMDRLEPFVPYRTSGQRYLIARKPLHPNENAFWVPVQVAGYYMETHKDYKTAIKQLNQFLSKGGLRFRYVR